MKNKSLLATEQDGNTEEGIQGIWIETKEQNSGIYYGYIPIKPSKKIIEKLPFSKRNDPIRSDPPEQSELSIFRKNRKIAEILKQYVLYTYSLHPEDFDENWIWVDPDHTYDIEKLNKRLIEGNDVIYRDGYIVVPSENVKTGLMSYLKVNILNNTPGVMAIKDEKTIENYYLTISDFRNIPEQLIFVNKNGLKRWKREAFKKKEHGPVISAYPIQATKDPYYYKNPKIKTDKLMIVQNVKSGGLEQALTVSYKWTVDRINTGHDAPISNIVDNISYVVYTEMGELNREKRKTNFSSIFLYEDGTYAALMFFI